MRPARTSSTHVGSMLAVDFLVIQTLNPASTGRGGIPPRDSQTVGRKQPTTPYSAPFDICKCRALRELELLAEALDHLAGALELLAESLLLPRETLDLLLRLEQDL